MTSVVVLDYGSGNLRSAERAVARTGADVTVADSGAVLLYKFGAEGPLLLRPPLTGLGRGNFGASLAIADVDGDGRDGHPAHHIRPPPEEDEHPSVCRSSRFEPPVHDVPARGTRLQSGRRYLQRLHPVLA